MKHLRENHNSDLENLAVISPDKGGVGRADALKKRLVKTEKHYSSDNYSLAMTIKLRDKPGSIEDMFLNGDVNGKNIIIVDDICDSGDTLLWSARLLKANGAKKLLAYTTHALFTKGTKEILDTFDVFITSNTHYDSKKNRGSIEVIDMTSTFAEAIYRAQKGLSVSKLFE